ncbi:MAG: DUF2252 family protein [Myxococcaceae bacterium]
MCVRWLTVATLGLCASCAQVDVSDARKAELINVLTRADNLLLRSRPGLVANKYQVMSEKLYDFYRGNLAIARQDWEMGRTSKSHFGDGAPLIWGVGDPHPENFGILLAPDGTAAFEPNDFDASDRVPWLWDLRRLIEGAVMAIRASNAADPAALETTKAASSDVVRALALEYAQGLQDYAAGAPRERITGSGGGTVLEDLFSRSARDVKARVELTELTTVENGVRRITRGLEGFEGLIELPKGLGTELQGQLPLTPYGKAKDAVRELGGGVASLPKIRLVVLCEGPTADPADDIMLTLKEIGDSGLQGWGAPLLPANDSSERVLEGARRAWAQPDADAAWGGIVWRGVPFLIRSASEGNKGVNVDRLEKARGTPAAFTQFATVVGRLLARIHAANDVTAIADRLRGNEAAFAEEEVENALSAADQTEQDFALFNQALVEKGSLLGFRTSPSDEANSLAGRELLEGTP